MARAEQHRTRTALVPVLSDDVPNEAPPRAGPAGLPSAASHAAVAPATETSTPVTTEILPVSGPDAAARSFALERGRALTQSEHSASVDRLRRSLYVGLGVWLATIPFDLGVALLTREGHLPVFLVMRAMGIAIGLCSIVRLRRQPEPTPRQLIFIDLFNFAGAALLVSLASLTYRGLASPYAPGIMIILIARGAMTAAPWRQSAWLFGIPALTYPLVAFTAMFFDADIAAQLKNPAYSAPFACTLYMLLESWALMTVGGHLVWQVRREALEMKNIGRYQLQRRLGSGGMGEVWAAFDTTLKQRVALKTVSGHRPESPLLERLEREVRALAGLTHPNTVRVYDYGVTQDGLWYYAMELLHGETLRDAVDRRGALPPDRVVSIARQVLRALGEAHDQGIIHRDIKPENVFLAEVGGEVDVVKLLDFGIAKTTSARDMTLTSTGCVAGTPAYMAPELILGRSANVCSDIYSLGAMLYFALSGRLPFLENDLWTLCAAHLHRKPEPLSSVASQPIPPELENIVQRCMEKVPADRYASTRDVLESLEA
jgi:eukaryotic-like serine/threonine-protein kinase